MDSYFIIIRKALFPTDFVINLIFMATFYYTKNPFKSLLSGFLFLGAFVYYTRLMYATDCKILQPKKSIV